MNIRINNSLTLLLIVVFLLKGCSGCEQVNDKELQEISETQKIKFTTYENLGGNSGVAAYQIGSEFIRVQFSTGAIYQYTYESAGQNNIEEMKNLAKKGQGLNGYINRNVKYRYAARER